MVIFLTSLTKSVSQYLFVTWKRELRLGKMPTTPYWHRNDSLYLSSYYYFSFMVGVVFKAWDMSQLEMTKICIVITLSSSFAWTSDWFLNPSTIWHRGNNWRWGERHNEWWEGPLLVPECSATLNGEDLSSWVVKASHLFPWQHRGSSHSLSEGHFEKIFTCQEEKSNPFHPQWLSHSVS